MSFASMKIADPGRVRPVRPSVVASFSSEPLRALNPCVGIASASFAVASNCGHAHCQGDIAVRNVSPHVGVIPTLNQAT